MKNVLIVANLTERYYYEPFIIACEDRVNVFVFDPASVPYKSTLHLYLGVDGVVSGFVDVYKIKNGVTELTRLTVSDIDIAWHLRENCNWSESSTLEKRFTQNESRGAVRSFLSTLDCVWVNKKEDVDLLSSNKLYQQKIARQCGLVVPSTIIGNSPDDAIEFSGIHNGLLLKSIGYIKLDDAGKYFLYSERFDHEEIAKSSKSIHLCPIFAQEYVDKAYEYRVMVIGDKVLSCRIDSQASERTKVDWRHYDLENVEHVEVDLPALIQQRLLDFMHRVGLRYGAIDMIETPSGELVFLEVNPSGQWGWIADLAGLPIPEAVAEMLATL